MRRLFAMTTLLVVLGACGLREPLRPADGQALPRPAAYAGHVPTPDELLAIPSEFRPVRVDEPLTRSERRTADPFDLPPTDVAGSAPAGNSQAEPDEPPPSSGATPR